MIVEPTLADRAGTGAEQLLENRQVALAVGEGGIVRVQSRREGDDVWMCVSDRTRLRGSGKGFTNTHDATGSSRRRPFDARVPIDVECRIAEVRVAVDEFDHGKKRTA